MKIQTLGIIFIIIIVPITFALSIYTKTQMDTLSLQMTYDSKLQQSTHDALQAFQINTAVNTESNLADSRIKDIEASVSTFLNSLASNLELRGYSSRELLEYIPALVYTMYDGYYIYSPFSNIATTTDKGVVVNEAETENVEYGLKPYIYYSCRYKRGASDDFIITYSLDNYIQIRGTIGGTYINDAGYLISNIELIGTTYKYNGIEIGTEELLKEYIGDTEYPYIKISGTKYYWDQAKGRIFYMLNGNMHEQVSINSNTTLYNKYVQLIQNNPSAVNYYKEAYEFTNRVLGIEYNLSTLKRTDARDAEGNEIEFATNTYTNIFKQDTSSDHTPLEYSTSNFNKHRKEVIRYAIETNLSMAIANFNRYSKNVTYDYQMPVLKETEWDMLASNISIVSFLQGLNIGTKVYNGYSVVLNTETKELVREEDIFIIGGDNSYHRVEDPYLVELNSIEPVLYSKGLLDLDLNITTMNSSDNNTLYYYPKKELACYHCIVNQLRVDKTYSNVYEYLDNLPNNAQTRLLKKTYYTALGRERWGNQIDNSRIISINGL